MKQDWPHGGHSGSQMRKWWRCDAILYVGIFEILGRKGFVFFKIPFSMAVPRLVFLRPF